MIQLAWYGSTFIGRREDNQDALTVLTIDEASSLMLFAVADGMGGAAGGAVASRAALRAVREGLAAEFDRDGPRLDLKQALRDAMMQADRMIARLVANDSGLLGMGTTLACVLVSEDRFVIGSVGDSRVYWFDALGIRQLTTDHNVLELRRQSGCGASADVSDSVAGQSLVRAVDGSGDAPELIPADGTHFELVRETGLILCTDGLSLEGDTVHMHLAPLVTQGSADIAPVVEHLIETAYEGGSGDNITALCVVVR